MKDIPGYEGIYKFDNEIEKVYNIKKNRYLKNTLIKGLYYISLYKNGKIKTYNIRQLSNMCNLIENNNLVDIPNYKGLYKFDNSLLQVYNIKTNLYLKNNLNYGYYVVNLYKNGKIENFYIHKLVYIINNPTEDIIAYDIDHIDCDRTNNKIENLRKATRSENMSNKKVHKNNKSTGIKYIYKTKWNTYRFSLVKNKINYYKNFKTLDEAIEYRDRVVLEKCGEFARLD